MLANASMWTSVTIRLKTIFYDTPGPLNVTHFSGDQMQPKNNHQVDSKIYDQFYSTNGSF